MDRTPRQLRSDGAAPLALHSYSDSETSMRIAMRARTIAGRGKVRLEWEVKPIGAPFGTTGREISDVEIDTGIPGSSGSVVTLNEVVDAIAPGGVYKWRARVVTDSPWFPRGPWFTLAGNARTEADFRTTDGVVGAPQVVAASGTAIELSPPRPNPSAGNATIVLALRHPTRAEVAVFDVRGALVATLLEGEVEGGMHTLTWDGRDGTGRAAAPGVYFVRAGAAGDTRTVRLVRVR
jgi:hypothetical protein